MGILSTLYRENLALHTDLYELTMAYGYWKSGLADRQAVFYLAFRHNPFGGGYAVACGLNAARKWSRRSGTTTNITSVRVSRTKEFAMAAARWVLPQPFSPARTSQPCASCT
ncbi:MAG: hypothetical protein HGB11_12525 [Chlorobiales bacterium]|nr:hypothetical protein [Chlorobiales bacterium]